MQTLTEEQQWLRQEVLDRAGRGIPASETLQGSGLTGRDQQVVRETLDAQANGQRS